MWWWWRKINNWEFLLFTGIKRLFLDTQICWRPKENKWAVPLCKISTMLKKYIVYRLSHSWCVHNRNLQVCFSSLTRHHDSTWHSVRSFPKKCCYSEKREKTFKCVCSVMKRLALGMCCHWPWWDRRWESKMRIWTVRCRKWRRGMHRKAIM